MADKKITDLTALTAPDSADVLAVVDVSPSGETKKSTVAQLNAVLAHQTLSGAGTNTHAQLDTFVASKAQASGIASLDGSTKVVQDPANATATATASKIPIADGSGKLDTWVSDASGTVKGKVELAIASEIDTGTDATRAIPVDQFVASKRNIRWLVFNLVAPTTDCAIGTNLGGDFVSPIAGTILQSDTAPFYLYATNSTAGTTGNMVVDININGTSIMTTNKLSFDSTEKTTTTSATPPDLTTTSLAVGDIITIDVDSVHTTKATGLTVYMAVRE